MLEPIGIEADDIRSSIIAAMIGNAHRDKKKKSQPFTVDEVRPVWDKKDSERHTGPTKHHSTRAQYGFMKRFAASWNRRFGRAE